MRPDVGLVDLITLIVGIVPAVEHRRDATEASRLFELVVAGPAPRA